MFCVEYELNYMHVSETEGKTLPIIFLYIYLYYALVAAFYLSINIQLFSLIDAFTIP